MRAYSARSSPASSANWKRPSECSRATARVRRQKERPPPRRRPWQRRRPMQRSHAGAVALRPQNRLVTSAACRPSAIRCLPWQMGRRSRKSPLHAKGLAQTMSASLPGTNGLAASQSATGSSTPHSRRRRCNAPRSETRSPRRLRSPWLAIAEAERQRALSKTAKSRRLGRLPARLVAYEQSQR